MILPLKGATPNIAPEVFVAPDAHLIGDVTLKRDVSVFFGAVLRGDILPITVGRGTNIQEHAILHTSHGRSPCVVGEHVTVGHRAIVHGCVIGDRCLIGMGAIILDDTILEEECLVGAGALVPEGKKVPPRSLLLGVPAKVVRSLTADEVKMLSLSAKRYIELGAMYRSLLP